MQRRFSSNTVDFVARCKAAERRVEGRDTEQHRCMFADGRLLSFLSFFSSSRSLNGSKINKRKMTNFNHRALLFFLRLLLPFICLWNETLLVFLRIPWPRFTAWPVLQFVRKQIEMWRRQRERRMRSKRRESVCRGWAGWAERRWKAEKTKRWAVHKTKVAFTPQQPVWPPCRSCCAFFFFFTLLRLLAKKTLSVHTTNQQLCPFPPSPLFFVQLRQTERQHLRCRDSRVKPRRQSTSPFSDVC